MALTIPADLKKITQFIRRAEELDSDTSQKESRVVAYYCRQHAVQQGIPLAGLLKENKKCLAAILGQLEGEKEAMAVFTKEEAKLICRSFADKIFSKADNEDRAGAANKGTARTFYAAATFYEILHQFYDGSAKEEDTVDGKTVEQAEEDERRVYCKWKATEILKALREGRKPTPGGFGDGADDADEAPVGGVGSDGDVYVPPPPPPAPTDFPPAPPAAPPAAPSAPDHEEGTEMVLGAKGDAPADAPPPAYPGSGSSMPPLKVMPLPPPPPPAPAPASTPRAPPASNSGASNFWGGLGGVMGGKKTGSGSSKVSKEALDDATELTKFALSALQNKKPDLAAERLQQALKALGQ